MYTVVLLAGGATGYANAKSTPPLIAGIVAAALAAVAAGLRRGHQAGSGLGLESVLSLVMAVFFFARFRRTGKAMPAVPVIVLGALVLVASLVRHTL